jgi:hypothetical protein
MNDSSLKPYYKVLELSPEASPTEVKNAYLRLKRLYTENSPIVALMTAEFPPEKRASVLKDIEEAYQRILASFKLPSDMPDFPADRPSAAGEETSCARTPGLGSSITGAGLKRLRESRGISLADVYRVTKIRAEILENIEEERYDTLPDETFLKTHLVQYARFLGVDPERALESILKRYSEWHKRHVRGAAFDRKK